MSANPQDDFVNVEVDGVAVKAMKAASNFKISPTSLQSLNRLPPFTVAAREQIEALYDARFFRMWTLYLAGAATVFQHGGMVNFQIQYARSRHALPITRDYMIAN